MAPEPEDISSLGRRTVFDPIKKEWQAADFSDLNFAYKEEKNKKKRKNIKQSSSQHLADRIKQVNEGPITQAAERIIQVPYAQQAPPKSS